MTNGAVVDQNRETEVPGIYACGNVLHVHDLVDFVSEEAAIAGKAAAEKITEKSAAVVRTIRVKTGMGVRYTVPEALRLPEVPNAPVRIFFRVTDIFKKVRLLITDTDGNVLVKNAKSAVAPGEMESMTLTPELLTDLMARNVAEITVSLEAREG